EAAPTVERIGFADLRDALAKGLADFGVFRSDVIFLCLLYPIVGLVLSRAAFGHGMLPLIFPLASGFALLGPAVALGLYEMSRERENGQDADWRQAFGVMRSPAFGAMLLLGLLLLAIFALWQVAAFAVYNVTFGPQMPASLESFARDVPTTVPGWTMIVVGCGVGFVFAAVVLTISVVSFPLLLDRQVGLSTAIVTSVRAVRANPGPMAAWGLIVAAGLVVGAIPLMLGYAIVIPVLGHATWHLYRRVVPRPAAPRLTQQTS
ncbi:MAG: DUF2189 domain-containing protein, partial [Proteobacteria bacterium]|nr:DUF2189 domain-containing protein [Pseudomonadota bacterium]